MIVLSGIAGALLGAVGTGLVAWLISGRQIEAQDAMRRRDHLSSLIGDFWGATDRLWRAKQSLGWTVYEMGVEREARQPPSPRLEERRQEEFVRIRAGIESASASLGLIRIIEPGLAETAEQLFQVSQTHYSAGNAEKRQKHENDHAAARDTFEQAAREALS